MTACPYSVSCHPKAYELKGKALLPHLFPLKYWSIPPVFESKNLRSANFNPPRNTALCQQNALLPCPEGKRNNLLPPLFQPSGLPSMTLYKFVL